MSSIPSILAIVKNDDGTLAKAYFEYLIDGDLWYRCNGFAFPIPLHDTEGGVFKNEMQGITLMRWIHKQRNVLEEYERQRQEALSGSSP